MKGVRFVADKDKDTNINPSVNRRRALMVNTKFTNYLNDVSTSAMGNDASNSNEIDAMRDDMDKILNREYSGMTVFSGKSFTDFINDALKGGGPGGEMATNIDKVINDDANAFSTFFYERYKNINNRYEDLRMVTEQLCELSTAVTTLRDSVVASDGAIADVSKTVVVDGLSDEDTKKIKGYIDEIDEKYNLDQKMHDIIVPNTLTYGDFFVFHQPYSRIFTKFKAERKERPYMLKEALSVVPDKRAKLVSSPNSLITCYESAIPNTKKTSRGIVEDIDNDVNVVYEAYTNNIKTMEPGSRPNLSKSMVKEYLTEKYMNIEVINDGDAPLMEDASISSLQDPALLKLIAKKKRDVAKGKTDDDDRPQKAFQDIAHVIPDGVRTNGGESEIANQIDPEYKDVTGIYLKMLNPLRTVPVYVLDECVGYYILYETYGEIRNNMLQNNQLNRTNLVFQQVRNKDSETSMIDVIASRIINKIDNKFIKNNLRFRDLMVNALMYDDLYRKDFKVQFVSVEYMTHFKINEDIDSHLGTSMLKKSLFYAKLYMTMLMFKIISAVTRSNDTRVFYIKNSGIEKNIVNQVQRAARDYKDNQISFNDIASVNTLISKAGKAKDLFVGIGKGGEKAVDFDIISGQDVQMDTDMIQFLRKNMINGTDVPMVILEYNDTADFAKSIDMGNIKYANKINSTQRELSAPATQMYRALLKYEYPDLTDDELLAVTYKFNKPKSLLVQNDADSFNNAEQAATFLVKVICGDNTDKYSDKVKDGLFRHIISTVTLPGMFDWDALEKVAEDLANRTKQDTQIAELSGNQPQQ